MLPRDTARIHFREMASADLDAMAVLLGDPRAMKYYPAPKTRDQAAAWITWNQRNYAEYGYGLWIIETHAGEFIGDCGLTWQKVDEVRKLEVGYHVSVAWQGHGIATEAASACVEFAREHVEVQELFVITHPRNRPSQRVAEKIGMHRVLVEDRKDAIPRTVFSIRL